MNQHPLIRGKTDLKTRFPAVAGQWDYERNTGLTPADVQPASMKKIWWKCEKGHSWHAAVYSRTAGAGCPFCSGNRLNPGVNDLLTVAPQLAAQWDYEKNNGLKPENVAGQTAMKVWWRCEKGHSWQAVVSSRTAGKGCPYCAGRKVMSGFNDLATANPELALEWNYEKNGRLLPGSITGNSHRKVWWTGSCGHSWEASVANRNRGCGCPYCCGKKLLVGFNDAGSRHPELMLDWDYGKNKERPEQIMAGSHRKVWWKCQKGHSWEAKIADRIRGNGCPYCSNRRILYGENDFAHVHPELTLEWDHEKNGGLSPEEVTYQSRKKVWWKCPKGHSWKTEIYHRAKGSGCPVCARRKNHHPVTAGKDLMTVSPKIASEWDYERNMGLTPDQVLPFSTRKVWWVCKRGHHWQCTIQIRQKGTGCPFCDGRTHRQSRLI